MKRTLKIILAIILLWLVIDAANDINQVLQ
jgi:hypothetical protein